VLRLKKFLAAVLVLGLVSSLVAIPWSSTVSAEQATVSLAERFTDYDLTSTEPISVIVKFAGDPWAVVEHSLRAQGIVYTQAMQDNYLNTLLAQQARVIAAIHQAGLSVSIARNYSIVYNGISISIPANQVEKLLQVPGVVDVHPDIDIFAQGLDFSLPAIGAPQAWALPPGLSGSGILVAVLDTGADYMHPDLGGGIGPGFKVVGGWDFVDDDNDPMEQKNDPGINPATGRDWNTSHGTHVAATVAAVAPAANLYIIRVLGRGGSGSSSDVMAGIERAVLAGAHVANMSLGAALGHPDSPWAEAVDNAVRAGVVFTVSAGNSGIAERTIGTYANTRLGIAVGWADSNPKPLVLRRGATTPFVGTMMTFSPPLASIGTEELEFVDVGLGNVAADFRNPDGTSRVTGRIALMQRGGAAFAVKSRNARDAGAIGAIIWNNVPGLFAGTLGHSDPADIPTLSLSMEAGNALLAMPVADRFATFSMGMHHLMSSSSSRGPTALLDIAPHVSAPGEAITAAYPFPGSDGSHVSGAFQKNPGVNNPWFGTISGTSMAAPHVAGAAALMLQANPTWTPETVRLALMNTAQDIKRVDGLSFRPIDQGAGMINILRALTAGLRIDPGMLNFREVVAGETQRTLEVQSLATGNAVFRTRVEKFNAAHAYEVLLPSQVTVNAGARITVPVTLFVDVSLPVSVANTSDYGGFIIFENVANPLDSYRVPFQFFNRLAISQLSVSPDAFSPNGDGVQDTVTISFVVGQPLNAVRFAVIADPIAGGAGAHLFFAETGPLLPGEHSFVWNGAVPAGWRLRETFNQVHAQWQVLPTGAWVGGISSGAVIGPAFARLTVDNAPPTFHNVRPVIDPARPNNVVIRGNADDLLISTVMSAGGSVWVNDERQHLFSQNIPGATGWDWVGFTSQAMPVNLRETSVVRLRARDAAGNQTEQNLTFTALTINATPTHTSADSLQVTGRVVPGMILTVNGAAAVADDMGVFSVAVPLVLGHNSILVGASVPQWGGAFAPVTQVIEIIKTPTVLSLRSEATPIRVNDHFVVDIAMAEVTDMYGAEVVVSFNPQLVQVVDADPALDGVQIRKGTALESVGAVTYVVNTVDNTTGVIRLSSALLGTPAGFTGSGVLGQIEFRAIAAGTLSPAIAQAAAADSRAGSILFATSGPAPIAIGASPTAMTLIPEATSRLVNETYMVDIAIAAVMDLRAVELLVTFNPLLVQVVDADPALEGVQIHKGTALESVGTVTYTANAVDNVAGTISLSSAVVGATTGVSGSGVLGRVEFRTVAAGTATPVIAQATATAGGAWPIHFAIGPTAPVLVGTGTVSGRVELPGRQVLVGNDLQPRFGGVTVTVAGIEATTNDAGAFTITGVPAGTMSITARVAGYLPHSSQVTINSANPNVAVNIVLVSGDLNGDGRVNVLDIVIISQAFGSVHGSTNWDLRADINLDGKVDVLDLVAVTRNFGS